MKKQEILCQIRRTAAVVLAAAITDYVPQSHKVKGGITPWGFYYDFIMHTPPSKEIFPLIEERMHHILSKEQEIQVHEMISSNAGDFLKHHRQFYAAHFAETASTPFVQVFQMGEIIDYVEGNCLSTSRDLKVFKLLDISVRPDLKYRGTCKKVYRILGTAASQKGDLKSLMRHRGKWWEQGHLLWGEERGLFRLHLKRGADHIERASIYWRDEGEKVIHGLKELWRREYLKENFELVSTGEKCITEAHQKLYQLCGENSQSFCIAELRSPTLGGDIDPLKGFCGADAVHQDVAHVFCSKKHLRKHLISSLKFLEKIPKMLQLKYQVLVFCPKELRNFLEEILTELKFSVDIQEGRRLNVEWQIEDEWERLWSGPYLTLTHKRGEYLLKQSAFCSLEQMLALVLESEKKDLSQKKEILSKIARLDELG